MRRIAVLRHVLGVALAGAVRDIVELHGLETLLGAVVVHQLEHVSARVL